MQRVEGVRCTTGESPVWSAAEQAWYWVDIPAKRVWRLDHASGKARYWTVDEMVACVAPKRSGGLVAGMETGLFSLELGEAEAAQQRKLAAPSEGLGAGYRFNDGRCDRQGRFVAGTMFMDMSAVRAEGRLFIYDAVQGLRGPFVSDLVTQNGSAFSPDGRTMYLSDSHPQRRMVWAFDYDTDTGTPSNRRLFADLGAQVGRPDGAAVDADGCYWTAGNDGGCLLRFTPEGKLDRRIDVPMLKPSMLAFGGRDLDTLLVTSIVSGKPEDAAWGGSVIMLDPGVQGVADVAFAG
jgi:sugar lactone lactonase YvrE